MSLTHSRWSRGKLLALALLIFASPAGAEEAWTKMVRIIVPVAPGGSADLTARLVGTYLQKRLGTTVIVENKPGGSGQVAVEAVLQSGADGHTLLVSPNGIVTVKGGFRPDFPDLRKALTPISKLANVPVGIAVNPTSPAKTLGDFIALAKNSQQPLLYSVPLIGTHMHLVGEMFRMETGARLSAVPYKGTAPATVALATGEVQATVSDLSTLLPQARAGRLRILAATDPERATMAPDIPTVAESGVPGFGLSAWIGMFAVGGSPADALDRLNRETVAIMNMPDVRSALLAAGLEAMPTSRQEMTDIMERDTTKWAKVVKDAGIKFE
ncbi:tripartite tricarboxylate transporter substrate binding protein [Roseiarcaceae bacterium H3SJ34-1]|uniref:Bug family tripartite tricarboxylate transporter substrate binding protein n=1 Tax=Terripilifer ovatus TaxID=3032367 RepID=UPI003AB95007|nr:tripartite tricarboxylate transporter substrate binding protein [Roseiarcaceae bacterium H3SJ34-1]